MLICDFLKNSKCKYYNVAIYLGVLSGDLDKNIFIKSVGGNVPFAFSELKRIRDFSSYCELNSNDGIPIPLFEGVIARCHDYLAAFIYSKCESAEFVEIEKKYEPTIFDESWLKSFLNKNEVLAVKRIYFDLLDKSWSKEPAIEADKSE